MKKSKIVALFLTLCLGLMAGLSYFMPTESGTTTAFAATVEDDSTADGGRIKRLDLEGLSALPKDVDEFEITTDLGLFNFSTLVNNGELFVEKTVFLANDVDYTKNFPYDSKGGQAIKHVPIGTTDNPFRGNFDGSGFAVTIIGFFAASGEPVGFFGKTEGSLIKNLTVTYSKDYSDNPMTTGNSCIGAVVGCAAVYTDNTGETPVITATSVINCENKINITNSNPNGIAGGIVGRGDGFRIMNCINAGTISATGTNGKVGKIIGNLSPTSSPQMLLSCVNFGEIIGNVGSNTSETELIQKTAEISLTPPINKIKMGNNYYEYGTNVYNDDYIEVVNVKKLIEWGTEEYNEDYNWNDELSDEVEAEKFEAAKVRFLRELNVGVRASRIECARAAQPKPVGSGSVYANRFRRHMLYWGFGDDGLPTVHTDKPVLDANLMFEYTHKQTGAIVLFRQYQDRLYYVSGGDTSSVKARDLFYRNYLLLTQELNDMYQGIEFVINDGSQVEKVITHDNESELEFFKRMAEFTNVKTIEEFKDIFDEWKKDMNDDFVTGINSFAINMIESWCRDCVDFVTGTDDLAEDAKTKLETKFQDLKDELLAKDFKGEAEYTLEVTDFITEAIIKLDNIYYEWQVGNTLVEFAGIYESLLESVSRTSVRNKMKVKYEDALAAISDAKIDMEKWVDYADEVSDLYAEATAALYDIHETYEKSQTSTTIIIIIASAATILVAAVAVLLTIMARNEKRLRQHIAFDSVDRRLEKKDMVISERAQAIDREAQFQRERAEMVAQAQREKARMLAHAMQLKKEKEEMAMRLAREQYDKEMELKRQTELAQSVTTNTEPEKKSKKRSDKN